MFTPELPALVKCTLTPFVSVCPPSQLLLLSGFPSPGHNISIVFADRRFNAGAAVVAVSSLATRGCFLESVVRLAASFVEEALWAASPCTASDNCHATQRDPLQAIF
eukprot:jgi/Psemu1/54432/gm1.54432_g